MAAQAATTSLEVESAKYDDELTTAKDEIAAIKIEQSKLMFD